MRNRKTWNRTLFYVAIITYITFIFVQYIVLTCINPLSANSTKWPNTLKQIVGNLPTNYLSVFDHFVELAFKGLRDLFRTLVNIYDVVFLPKVLTTEHRKLFLPKYSFVDNWRLSTLNFSPACQRRIQKLVKNCFIENCLRLKALNNFRKKTETINLFSLIKTGFTTKHIWLHYHVTYLF